MFFCLSLNSWGGFHWVDQSSSQSTSRKRELVFLLNWAPATTALSDVLCGCRGYCQCKMRAVAVTSSLTRDPFKFQQHSSLPASPPWHIKESCSERLELLKLNFTLAVSWNRGLSNITYLSQVRRWLCFVSELQTFSYCWYSTLKFG